MIFVQQVFLWWFVLYIFGLIALPLTTRIFSSFFDKGYAFSKIIGLIITTYLIYFLGTIHVLQFNSFTLIGLVCFLGIASFLFYKNQKKYFQLPQMWKIFLCEEVLFFLSLLFWSYIKGFQPDIHGLEKFMDYGFINSILRTTYFPAKDMWMAPLSINYYYFGHIMTAALVKISFLPSNIAFNLMLATLFALTITESFSLGANFIFLLQKQFRQNIKFFNVVTAGIITAILLTFGGNLHTLYTFFTPYHNDSPVAPIQLAFSPQTFPNQYWYPNATRFIYHTIHEFPVYSFVVSDLHGHVLDIPAVLLMISVLLLFFLTPFTKSLKFFLRIILLGSLASIMYMTNAWDGLIYVGVATFVIFIKITFQTKKIQFSKELLLGLCTLFVSFIVISLPFSFFFKPFASQIGINCAPQALLNLGHIGPIVFEPGYCQTSPLWQLAILYGFFFFWFVSLGAFITRAYRKTKQIISIDLFVLGMGILGFFLIIIPEFVYLKDIYTTYFRANTMFKLVYQSFILLSLVSGYTMYRIFSIFARDKKNIIKRLAVFCYTTMSIIMLSLVLIYPYFAVMSYFNQLKNFQGLNGITYLKTISADDYQAVLWINQHIKGQPTLLEAQGDSYTDYERISSNTGLPTVFGWMVHEWLWRGTYDIVPQRIADVKALYESPSIAETKKLLQKYQVSYVYIGDMERSKYEKIDEKKFIQLGTVVYSSGDVRIYRID